MSLNLHLSRWLGCFDPTAKEELASPRNKLKPARGETLTSCLPRWLLLRQQLRNANCGAPSPRPPKLLSNLEFSARGLLNTVMLNLIIQLKNPGCGGAFGFPLQEQQIASVNNPLLREPLCHLSLLGSSTLPCWVWDRRHSAPSVTGSFWKSDSQGEMDGVRGARPGTGI